MPEVTISDRTVHIERFTLAKAMRVITLLQLIQKQAPEVSKEWATFRRQYAEEYGTELDRNHAVAMFPTLRELLTDADWERAGQKHKVPGQPSQAEVFFQMAPIVYERAEAVTLRLLGLIAMDNETVARYLKSDTLWERVDELVDELIRPAALDEIMELGLVAAEVIDGQVLAKARSAGDRVGNVLRLFGWGKKETTTTDSTDQSTSNGQPEQPSSTTSTGSPSDTDGTPTTSEDSTGETSKPSSSGSPVTA